MTDVCEHRFLDRRRCPVCLLIAAARPLSYCEAISDTCPHRAVDRVDGRALCAIHGEQAKKARAAASGQPAPDGYFPWELPAARGDDCLGPCADGIHFTGERDPVTGEDIEAGPCPHWGVRS